MGIKITEMTPAESLNNDDLFEISQKTGGYETKSITALGIKNYVKNSSNGGFKGIISASDVDTVTAAHVGVWFCNEPYTIDRYAMTGSIVEVITYAENLDNVGNLAFIQRLTWGANAYQRWYSEETGFTQWMELSNHNSSRIDFGSISTSSGSTQQVNFNIAFDKTPIVIVTPNYNTNDQFSNTMAIPFVLNTTQTGFTVGCWISNVKNQTSSTTAEETTSTTETSSSTVTTTTNKTIETSNLNWALGQMSLDWIAVCDDTLTKIRNA